MLGVAEMARDLLEAWNRRDWGRYREMLHPEFSYTGGDGQRREGPEVGLAVAQGFASAFPDGRIDVQRIHTSGVTAIAEFIGRGTHEGEFMGIAPTGREVEIPVVDVLETREGLIRAEREYMDMLYLMQQMGAAPGSPPA
ncbi:MAG: ester cyclase [Dehalococcoidia bacterium]|nr:ester cyclase [Dehalococcoidia bacterium]